MADLMPDQRDSQLVEALEQAIRSHSKKHYHAGLADGFRKAFEIMRLEMSEDDKVKYRRLLNVIVTEEARARLRATDQKPKPPSP